MESKMMRTIGKVGGLRGLAQIIVREPAFLASKTQARKMTSTPSHVHEVLAEAAGSARIATLNRPKALNALNTNMCRVLTDMYTKWEKDDSCKVIIMRGSGDKAFCAGGDVVSIAKAGMAGDTSKAFEFFDTEYKLNCLIGTLKKPHVALIDGITMGGGVGLSVHGIFRVATETTLFAMPETAIGLFPDVGGSHFLPRLKGELGMYLALSGARLKGQDVYHAGIATHYVARDMIPALVDKLSTVQGGEDDVKKVLDSFQAATSTFSLAKHEQEINDCFGKATMEEILSALARINTDFTKGIRDTIVTMSPTSCKVTLHQIREGAKLDLGECLKMEKRMACRFMEEKDFYEGIRAVLIDKTKDAKWTPSAFEDVTDDMVNSYFRRLPADQELDLPKH